MTASSAAGICFQNYAAPVRHAAISTCRRLGACPSGFRSDWHCSRTNFNELLKCTRISAHQKVLVDLQVSRVVGEVGGAVQWRKTLLVSLVHLCPHVQQVVHLRRT